MSDTTEPIGRPHCERASANAATGQTAQEAARSANLVRTLRRVPEPLLLRSLPNFLGYDAPFRHIDVNPLVRINDARLSRSRFGVFTIGKAAVDHAARVKGVLDDPVQSFAVAV